MNVDQIEKGVYNVIGTHCTDVLLWFLGKLQNYRQLRSLCFLSVTSLKSHSGGGGGATNKAKSEEIQSTAVHNSLKRSHYVMGI